MLEMLEKWNRSLQYLRRTRLHPCGNLGVRRRCSNGSKVSPTCTSQCRGEREQRETHFSEAIGLEIDWAQETDRS